MVAESTAECTSCSVDVEPEVVIEQEKSSSSGIVQEAVGKCLYMVILLRMLISGTVNDIRPDSLWSIGTIGEGRGKRVAHGLLPTTSKEALQFDISEEDKPAVALPKYDNRELEPELSWHHSGMYLNREPPVSTITLLYRDHANQNGGIAGNEDPLYGACWPPVRHDRCVSPWHACASLCKARIAGGRSARVHGRNTRTYAADRRKACGPLESGCNGRGCHVWRRTGQP